MDFYRNPQALLKIAAPDMNSDEEMDPEDEGDFQVEDEDMPGFDVWHCLTGGLTMHYPAQDIDGLWKILQEEAKVFVWDEDDDGASGTVKSRSTKKPNTKDAKEKDNYKPAITTLYLEDTKDVPAYVLAGITPAFEMEIMVSMIRDVPLKKPLPEPDIPQWKTYRWIDWARRHGLYELYECPRTKFLKVNGLMKLSYAPHLLDLQSTESITHGFREEHQTEKEKKPKGKEQQQQQTQSLILVQMKEELREWVRYEAMHAFVQSTHVVLFPSLFDSFTTAGSNPPFRVVKIPNKALDIQGPLAAPLYLQIDGPEESVLRISLNMIHPRILFNCGVPIEDHIERAYMFLECFEWFLDKELPLAKGYIQTRGYDTVELTFLPGRHFCRLWVHSRMHWHVALLSDSSLVIGTRDVIQAAACMECPWVSKYLSALGAAFANWFRLPRSVTNFMMLTFDRDFFSSYQPDLTWDPKVVGYDKAFVHWMFRQALQSHLLKQLPQVDHETVFSVLRRYFCDPDLGFPPKPKPPKSLREIMERDPCDCVMPEVEGFEEEENLDEQEKESPAPEEMVKQLLSDHTMAELLKEPKEPVKSQVCELATEEVPCGLLKIEREQMIKKHEAATLLQGHWRGAFARKCLSKPAIITSEVVKIMMEHVYGNPEAVGNLMKEFFRLFPGTRYAYSISAALSGVYGLHQHTGTCSVSPKCKWLPYFQGVFYCHAPVKVHFDINSTIEHRTVQIYDNDTGDMLPQACNAHITFDIHPNVYGYTVLGHGSLNTPLGHSSEAPWQLTVLTSIDNVFHTCDNNELEPCVVLPIQGASKLHIDEIFLPNRRNILGGIQIFVTKVEAVCFRASATTPDLEIEAILRTANSNGELYEVARCQGKGEIFWPYIRLKPASMPSDVMIKKSSAVLLMSSMALKGKTKGPKEKKSMTSRSVPKFQRIPEEGKMYSIEVIAPKGWAQPVCNWKRIEEVRQDVKIPKYEPPSAKKPAKDKDKPIIKDKEKEKEKDKDKKKEEVTFTGHEPLPDDAYTEIECSTTVDGGATARRDDDRDILFATALREWSMKEPGRNAKGASIRQQFRDEFLVPATPMKSESFAEIFGEELETPGEEVILEALGEVEEETYFFDMPEKLKDKFIPLSFVPLVTKELSDEGAVVLSDDMIEAARNERVSRLESALERMRQLQEWNKENVLGMQEYRIELLEKLLIDGNWTPELAMVYEDRAKAMVQEQLDRQASAARKKQDAKSAGPQTKTGKKT